MNEPEVLCGAKAEYCSCTEPAGHEPPHRCSVPAECGGEWTGTYGAEGFEVLKFPMEDEYPFGSVLAMLRFGTL